MKQPLSPVIFETYWNEIAEQVSSAMRLTTEGKFRLFNNMIAKHIVLIPFLSETETPRRDACSSLSIYLLSISPETKHLYSHALEDDKDPLHRLMNLMTYSNGSTETQKAGIALLVMNMIHGYIRDKERDKITGKYNPVVSGVWDSKTLLEKMNEYHLPCEVLYSQYIPKAGIKDLPWNNNLIGESTYGKKVL